MKAVITVIGTDTIGIIAGVSRVLADHNANILDISQTIMQEFFTMIMLVDLSKINLSLDELNKKLEETGESLGVSIKVQHQDIFKAMHRI